jgi:hypothetical protein
LFVFLNDTTSTFYVLIAALTDPNHVSDSIGTENAKGAGDRTFEPVTDGASLPFLTLLAGGRARRGGRL